MWLIEVLKMWIGVNYLYLCIIHMLITPIHFYNNIYITIIIHLFIHLFIYYIYIFIYTKHTINTCVFGVTFFQPLELPDTMAKGKSPRAPSKERGEVHRFDWGSNF